MTKNDIIITSKKINPCFWDEIVTCAARRFMILFHQENSLFYPIDKGPQQWDKQQKVHFILKLPKHPNHNIK